MDERPLHIGLVAPLWYPIAPDRGGIEQVIWLLATDLVACGHRVTLVASGDSARVGGLVPVCAESIAVAMERGRAFEYPLYEAMAVAEALRRAPVLDVLHSHLGARLVPFDDFVATPIIHTFHTSISGDMRWAVARRPGAQVTTVSRWQAAALADVAAPVVVPNGIDLAAFPFSPAADDYLLVLGRIEERKGVHVAIDVARAAGRPLVIAGAVADRGYFEERVRPHVDGERVRLVGPVGGDAKIRLLQGAHALLFPVQWEEAFGLVMVEAMACGTPVVALARGAVPEIVSPGENGLHAADPSELPGLVERVGAIDRARVRASVVNRFSHRRMVAQYEALYRLVVAGGQSDLG